MGSTKTTRIFISDIHMGDTRSGKTTPANPHLYGWFLDKSKEKEDVNQNRPQMLADFLENQVAADTSVNELVILGDLFDEWVCPPDFNPIQPPSENQFEAIATATQNRPVVKRLKALAKSGRLVYIAGNHDMLGTEKDNQAVIERILPGVRYIGEKGLGAYETADGILAGHGHRYCLFNAPWPDRSGPTGFAATLLPMGFDLARLDAGFVAQKGEHYNFWRLLWDAIRNVFFKEAQIELERFAVSQKHEALAGEMGEVIDKIIIDLFETFHSDEVFKGQAGIVYGNLDQVPGTVAWEAIESRYGALFSRWAKFHPDNVSALMALINETGDLESGAKCILRHQDCKIVLLGHTHERAFKTLQEKASGFDETARPTAHRIYANTGTWINEKPCSFVKTECDGSTHTVSVWEYKDGPPHPLPGCCGSVEV